MGTLLGNIEGARLSQALRERHIKRDVKMSCEPVFFSVGATLGNLEGILLPGLLSENDSITGFLPWTQRTLKFFNLEVIWIFGKGTGLS